MVDFSDEEVTEAVELSDLLQKELIAKGYPPESFDIKIRSKGRVCFIFRIVDPKTKKLLAIMALYVRNRFVATSNDLDEVRGIFLTVEKKEKVSFFLVELFDGKLIFNQFVSNHFIFLGKMIFFENLREKVLGLKKDCALKIISWGGAFILFIFLLLDWINWVKVPIKSVYLFVIIIGLLLIPYARKISIFDKIKIEL
ncbi:MAG: hypothetical protein WC882_05750 [Candidatus Gracilibacteria bacterium]